jgi:predicted O-methyltransferase YrrM
LSLALSALRSNISNICFFASGEAAGSFDFVYIDADKVGYVDYFHLCLPLVRSGGVIAVDNTLFRVRNTFSRKSFISSLHKIKWTLKKLLTLPFAN